MTDEDSFLRGERALYREDDAVCEVKVLENNSNRGKITYRFEITKIIHPHFIRDKKVGERFNCYKVRNVHFPGSGKLEELT